MFLRSSLSCASCVFSPSCLHGACAVGAEWEAYHRSRAEEPLWRLCVCGEQHCGSEKEQGGSTFCAGWDNIPVTAYYRFSNTFFFFFKFSTTFWMQFYKTTPHPGTSRYATVLSSSYLLPQPNLCWCWSQRMFLWGWGSLPSSTAKLKVTPHLQWSGAGSRGLCPTAGTLLWKYTDIQTPWNIDLLLDHHKVQITGNTCFTVLLSFTCKDLTSDFSGLTAGLQQFNLKLLKLFKH